MFKISATHDVDYDDVMFKIAKFLAMDTTNNIHSYLQYSFNDNNLKIKQKRL